MVFQAPWLLILAAVFVWIPNKLCGHFSDSRGLLRSNSRLFSSSGLQNNQAIPHFARNLMEETAETLHEFKIILDFSLSDPLPDTTYRFLNNYVFQPVIEMYRQMIKVNGTSVIPAFSETGCFKETAVPEKYQAGGISGDLIIFVVVKPLDPAINAISDSCGLDPKNGRPVIGQITLNLSTIRVKSTVIHELNHILAFDIFLFDYFQSDKALVYNKESLISNEEKITFFQIKMPKIIEYSRTFFDCPTIESLPMEDEGSISSRNSHFDKRVAGNEVMTAQREGRQIMSMFTLIFLASTGWYEVDFGFAEQFIYGKKNGCPIQKISEDKSLNVYSSPDKNKCSDHFMGKTGCIKTVFNSNHPQQIPLRKYRCSNTQSFTHTSPFEVPSSISRCFETEINSENSSGCYPVICQKGVPNVLIEDTIYTCNNAEEVIVHKDLRVKCNNFDLACKKPACEDDCNGNGVCLENGKCKCFLFFSGNSCKNFSECDSADPLCALVTPSNKKTWSNNIELISRFHDKLQTNLNFSSKKSDEFKKDLEGTTSSSSNQNQDSNSFEKVPASSSGKPPIISANDGSETSSGSNQTGNSTPHSNNKPSEVSPINQTIEPQNNSQNSSSPPPSTGSAPQNSSLPFIQSPSSKGTITSSSDDTQSANKATESQEESESAPFFPEVNQSQPSSNKVDDSTELSTRDSENNSIDPQSNQQEFSACSILKLITMGFLTMLIF